MRSLWPELWPNNEHWLLWVPDRARGACHRARGRAPDDRLREAIHRAAQRKNGLLRRFRLRSLSYGGRVAPRNDVAPVSNTASRSRGVIRPRFARTVRASINRGRRESRVANAPAASRAK